MAGRWQSFPRPAWGWAGERPCCLHHGRASPASQAGGESPGPLRKKVCVEEMSVELPSPNSSQLGLRPPASSTAAFGRGSWAKPRASYTVNQAVRVDSEPKSERKGKKRVSFLESSLAPAETEGPTILHHFAFSLPPLTQTVPRNRCVLPGPAVARRVTASSRACAVRVLWADPAHRLCCPRRQPAPWQPRFTSCMLVCPHEVSSSSGRAVSPASVKGVSSAAGS